MKKTNKIICKKCGRETECINIKENPTGDDLPYRWSYVCRQTGDVNDSACVCWSSEFYLCPDCFPDWFKQ